MIARIRRQAAAEQGLRRRSAVVAGMGDDCALLKLPPGCEALVTTDFSLEGIHFRRQWHPPESVGHRCLARGLSDIAAMGGDPVAAFLSLALPPDLPQGWVDRFMKGLLALARQFRVPLAGGDTAESPAGVLADILVVGRVPAGGALRRSGAQPGDSIYVTGELGRSAAILHQLRERGRAGSPRRLPEHFFPTPRLAVGRWLRERKLASAAIDLSDGLSTDLGHVLEESGVGALVYEYSIPRPSRSPTSTLHFALHGGEDYELLFTAPASRRIPRKIAGVRVTRIGEIIRGRRMWLVDSHGQRKPLVARGWEHFVGPSAVGRRRKQGADSVFSRRRR